MFKDGTYHDSKRLGMSPVPSGGASGQALYKASNTDGDTEWRSVAQPTQESIGELLYPVLPAEEGLVTNVHQPYGRWERYDEPGDMYDKINDAIQVTGILAIPGGDFQASDTVIVDNGDALILEPGARLYKPASAMNTNPVLACVGNYSHVQGFGQATIATEKDNYPNGIVVAGHLDNQQDQTKSAFNSTALNYRISDIDIRGTQAGQSIDGNIGLHVPSAQPVNNDNKTANQAGGFYNIRINFSYHGVVQTEFSNSHQYHNMTFNQLNGTSFRFIASQVSRIYGGTTTSGGANQTFIELLQGTVEGLTKYSVQNEVYGFEFEPNEGSGVQIDEGCSDNTIFMNNNSKLEVRDDDRTLELPDGSFVSSNRILLRARDDRMPRLQLNSIVDGTVGGAQVKAFPIYQGATFIGWVPVHASIT